MMTVENSVLETLVSPGSLTDYLEAHPGAGLADWQVAVQASRLAIAEILGTDPDTLHDLGPAQILSQRQKQLAESELASV
jgi:hypothetical protein